MDLQDFDSGQMYFEEGLSRAASDLIERAAAGYADGQAEAPLLQARELAPQSLTVIVALYRFYYYQHRYREALASAHRAMAIAAARLNFPECWQQLDMKRLAPGLMVSITLVRFYLMALKGAGYLNLRLGNDEEGIAMLRKVRSLDAQDRLGVKYLLQAAEGYKRRKDANFGRLSLAGQPA